jgi:hypothetical protein
MYGIQETLRNNLRHLHDKIQSSVLQDEVLHETADVNDPGHMNVANGGQLLVDAGSRADGTRSDLNAPDAGDLSETGVYGDHEGLSGGSHDLEQSVAQVHGMHRFFQRSIQVE